jgi:HK97 family phage portal protein
VSLFTRPRAQREIVGPLAQAHELIPSRTGTSTGSVHVTRDSALRMSAVWAAVHLRASLVSTMPVDVFRKVGDIQVEMSKPPILVAPGGERWDMCDWVYSTQMDIDRAGNTVGIITETNGLGLPARIDLQSLGDVTITERRDEGLRYRIGNKVYTPEQIWHERSHPVAGSPVGLSPVAFAAMSIGQYQSAQQFALDWYVNGGVPMGHLRNPELPTLTEAQADLGKARFKASKDGREIFVTGRDWEFKPIQAEAVGMEWLEAQRFGVGDVARFFDVPGDLIDAGVSSSSINYANITQRNLQFMVLHLGPAVTRRELALSRLIPRPRFVKLNRDAVLAMDPEMRARVMKMQIDSRLLTPNEGRALNNQPPLSDAQKDEFDRLFGVPKSGATTDAASDAATTQEVLA